jgi:DNA-binding NarL/FixJ family response regulator
MIRVLLADDQRLVRAGIRSILEDEDDIEVVAEAADGQKAISACRELRPDVVLMDSRMPGTDGLEAARAIISDERLRGTTRRSNRLPSEGHRTGRTCVRRAGRHPRRCEIAARLVVSPLTAKTHVSRIMAKLGARDRSQVVVLAYEYGMVSPGWLAD